MGGAIVAEGFVDQEHCAVDCEARRVYRAGGGHLGFPCFLLEDRGDRGHALSGSVLAGPEKVRQHVARVTWNEDGLNL